MQTPPSNVSEHRNFDSMPGIESGPIVRYEEAGETQEVSVRRFTGPDAEGDEVDEDLLLDSDVYRGEPTPSTHQLPRATTLTFETPSILSSDSSSSINVGRRIGAIAVAVEYAITRWARSHSSGSSTTSSSSSSSSSSGSSRRTQTTRLKRRRKYSETASTHNAARERELHERKRVYAESRVCSRDFTLFLPPDLADLRIGKPDPNSMLLEDDKSKRVIQTTSLPDIMARLDVCLKRSARARKKGKARAQEAQAGTDSGAQMRTNISATPAEGSQRGWWLDVSSPNWSDLRSIGKLLHLHPLTLEDILHQEPREKLELFPGLGYYFIIFRALEGEKSRERFRQAKLHGQEVLEQSSGDEGVIGAVNVYLVVFREGILSFHFEDISEHTDKLRAKIMKLENIYRMTSDWIAHGLLDSIVDAFFPVLTSIEKEVKELDVLVLEERRRASHADDTAERARKLSSSTVRPKPDLLNEKIAVTDDTLTTSDKHPIIFSSGGRKRLPLFPKRPSFAESWIKNFVTGVWQKRMSTRKYGKKEEEQESMYTTRKTLLRMAATRRIVTSLGRLLHTKGEVIAQIRKRLLVTSRRSHGHGVGLDIQDDGDIAIYMGDIQDHIYSLQHSLHHYERMLSHSHPAYLSQLRIAQENSKSGADKKILLLTAVSMTVPGMQLVLGLFSMNIRVPANASPGPSYSIFFIILAVVFLIGCGMVSLVRHWWVQAKKRYTRNRKLKSA